MPTILPGLSDDLWAKILVELEGGFTDGLCLRVVEPYSMAKAQSKFHQLRLVCHKFNDVFKGRPRLSRCLLLSPALTQESLPSLLAWLQQYGAFVEIFAAYCDSPCVEAALGKLMPPQTSLDNVFLSECISSAVQLMSGLTSLTYCEIVSPKDTVDLDPLKDLANLQKLHLTDGKFFASGLPAHLTNLTIEGANVWIQSTLGSSCVTSLQKLRVRDSQLYGLHPRGLLACSAVEHLQMMSCLVTADELEQRVDFTAEMPGGMPVCLPTGISALTSLSSLMLSLDNLGTEVFDLGPLHALTLLQDLFVHSEGLGISLRFSAELSALQKLTSLCLSASGRAEDDEDNPSDRAVANLHVDWSCMHALQGLTICNWHFTCTSSMVELTALRNLSLVDFDNSRPVEMEDEESSFKSFSLMVYRLARHCPHVALKIDEEMA